MFTDGRYEALYRILQKAEIKKIFLNLNKPQTATQKHPQGGPYQKKYTPPSPPPQTPPTGTYQRQYAPPNSPPKTSPGRASQQQTSSPSFTPPVSPLDRGISTCQWKSNPLMWLLIITFWSIAICIDASIASQEEQWRALNLEDMNEGENHKILWAILFGIITGGLTFLISLLFAQPGDTLNGSW